LFEPLARQALLFEPLARKVSSALEDGILGGVLQQVRQVPRGSEPILFALAIAGFARSNEPKTPCKPAVPAVA
jgi:hypothetical protein